MLVLMATDRWACTLNSALAIYFSPQALFGVADGVSSISERGLVERMSGVAFLSR
jgi:hypothetical protein